MPHLSTLNSDQVSAETQAIFAEIEQGFGGIPNLFKTYAHYPPLLRANWAKVKATLETGSLSPKLKQTIALLVSQDNQTEYCICAHSKILLDMGLSDDDLSAIRRNDLTKVGFTDKEIKLIDLIRQVNKNANQVSDHSFQSIKAAGVKDAELVEAFGVMETFIGFNKFLDALKVEIDV